MNVLARRDPAVKLAVTLAISLVLLFVIDAQATIDLGERTQALRSVERSREVPA